MWNDTGIYARVGLGRMSQVIFAHIGYVRSWNAFRFGIKRLIFQSIYNKLLLKTSPMCRNMQDVSKNI